MVELVVAVGFALIISAMCSLFEAVLYSVPLSYVEALAQRGSRAGILFKRMRDNVEQPISAILSLNTFAHTFGAAVAGSAATAVFGKAWLGTFSAAFTLAILLFSEIIPKTLGIRYCNRLSYIVAFPLQLLQWLFWPLTLATSWVSRRLGSAGTLAQISAEEIQIMARLGLSMGTIEGIEEAVIRNILALREVRAKDILTPRTVVLSLPKDLTLEEVRATSSMWPWQHSRVPVYEKDVDQVAGIVQRREVLAALADDKLTLQLSDLMRPIHVVPETITAGRLLHDFIERREHLFLVVDEFGGVAGVVTLEDVFEEILGQEIVDESDLTDDLQQIAQQRRRRILGDEDDSS
jgi:CBS domain containing-hemolysin-like protein